MVDKVHERVDLNGQFIGQAQICVEKVDANTIDQGVNTDTYHD